MSEETRDERTKRKLGEPDALETICAHVSNGGSLVNLCQAWDIRYSDALVWTYDKAFPARKTAYESALVHRTEFEIDAILGELRRIATVDIRQAFTPDGALKPIQDIPADVAACIQSIESSELWEGKGEDREQVGELKKIKFWDKLRSIELLGKKLALFIDRHQVSVGTLEELVAGSRQQEKPAEPAPDDGEEL